MFRERESSALSKCDTSEFTEYLLFPGCLSPGEADGYNYTASDVSITTRAVSIKCVRVNSRTHNRSSNLQSTDVQSPEAVFCLPHDEFHHSLGVILSTFPSLKAIKHKPPPPLWLCTLKFMLELKRTES